MATILDLNEDCLINIFSYLKIYELIRVESTCKLFQAVCKMVYPQFSNLRLERRYLDLSYFDDIMKRVSPHLKKFEFAGGYILQDEVKRTFISGVLNSPKLKSLTINYVQFSRELMVPFSTCFINLVYLNLERCNLDEDTMEGVFENSENFTNLKTLVISGNTMLTGKCILNLKYLEDLDASYCFDLSYKEFVRFLKNCDNLLRLDISACYRLLDEGNIIEDLLFYQENLEKLHYSYVGIDVRDERFGRFEKLKDLQIIGF